MQIDFSVLILIAFLAVIFVLSNTKKNTGGKEKLPEKLPYSQKYILTKPEYQFYIVLKQICDEHGYLICPKVGLKDLANVSDKNNYKHWFNKIASKHVDFVITDSSLKPYAAIELDDKSHKRADVKEKDEFKNRFFSSIGLSLHRIELNYTKESIEAKLFPNVSEKEASGSDSIAVM